MGSLFLSHFNRPSRNRRTASWHIDCTSPLVHLSPFRRVLKREKKKPQGLIVRISGLLDAPTTLRKIFKFRFKFRFLNFPLEAQNR